MNQLDIRQSRVIDSMRFPLIILVVFAHSLGFGNIDVAAASGGWNVYHFFTEMISHNFAKIAVCWFYVISGYFFFFSLKDSDFSFGWVMNKWKRRIFSLLIPFIIWNLLLVLLTVAKDFIYVKAGFDVDGDAEWLIDSGVKYWLWSGPANFPLYFMRDLMIMSLVAPLWYVVVRRLKWCSLVLLLLVYASPLNPSIPAMRAIFFFLSGAWLGIWKLNMLELCQKVKILAPPLAIALLLIATFYNSSACHEWLLRAFYPFAMITFMNICDRLASNGKRCDRLVSLSGSVFFIYATHEIFILGWTKGIFLRLFGNGLLASWVSYFSVPVIVLCVCVLLCKIFNRIMPKTLAFMCGGRIIGKL